MSNLAIGPEERHPRDIAAEKGLDYIEPEENELFIDIDDDASEGHYNAMMELLASNQDRVGMFTVFEEKRTVSKSGKQHIYCRVFDTNGDPIKLTLNERLLLQSVLGSDRKRDLLSFMRHYLKSDKPPTVFFEKKAPAKMIRGIARGTVTD